MTKHPPHNALEMKAQLRQEAQEITTERKLHDQLVEVLDLLTVMAKCKTNFENSHSFETLQSAVKTAMIAHMDKFRSRKYLVEPRVYVAMCLLFDICNQKFFANMKGAE